MDKPKIVFGILSSRDTVHAITELADLLSPHQIIVHHDFTKFAEFKIERDNVIILPDHVVTSWGGWPLVAATLKLMQYAQQHFKFDYFQLLSETCMPVKPVSEFEDFLLNVHPDAMMDLQPILSPEDPVFISHGWRYYPRNQFASRIFRKAIYLAEPILGWKQSGLINLKCIRSDISPLQKCLVILLKVLYRLLWLQNFFSRGNVTVCAVGGQWFGLSVDMLNSVLAMIEQEPALLVHYQGTHIPDESFFQTIVYHLRPKRLYPANHIVFWHSNGTGPDDISENDLLNIYSNKNIYFSRKFSLIASDSARKHNAQYLKKNHGEVY